MMWDLPKEAVGELLELPETGMGFQLVRARAGMCREPLLVLNAEYAFEIANLEVLEPEDFAGILRNGIISVQQMRADLRVFSTPALHDFELLQSRIQHAGAIASHRLKALVAAPSALVKSERLERNRIFYRFSAFNPDRRVNPDTGDFAPGTYATTEHDEPHVPSGLAAVGRYALPMARPASFKYSIEVAAGETVEYGTVAPAFGQAGGGVEALFRTAVANQAPYSPPKRIPDE